MVSQSEMCCNEGESKHAIFFYNQKCDRMEDRVQKWGGLEVGLVVVSGSGG